MKIRKNVNGVWKDVEITDEEIKQCMRKAYDKNKAIIAKIEKDESAMCPEQRAVLAGTLVRHYYYDVEELARSKMSTQKPGNSGGNGSFI